MSGGAPGGSLSFIKGAGRGELLGQEMAGRKAQHALEIRNNQEGVQAGTSGGIWRGRSGRWGCPQPGHSRERELSAGQ